MYIDHFFPALRKFTKKGSADDGQQQQPQELKEEQQEPEVEGDATVEAESSATLP